MKGKLLNRVNRILFFIGVFLPLMSVSVSANHAMSLRYLISSPKNISLYVGDDHSFQCSPQNTTWNVFWEKDGQRLDNNFTTGSDLILNGLREGDEGRYTCLLHDPWGRVKARVDAWLFVTPKIDISKVCGTITFWKGASGDTSQSAVEENSFPELAESDDSSASIWSSDSEINEAKKKSGLVVGGRDTKNGSAPFMVGIWIRRIGWNSWSFQCGASLLDQSWIVTAAHCLFNRSKNALHKEELKLMFGDFDTTVMDGSEKSRMAAEIILHEEYNPSTLDNDVALIRIEPPLREFTAYIRPICLAPISLSRHLTKKRTLGRVTGWGRFSYRGERSELLQTVELPIVDRKKCRKSVGEGQLTDNMFCAGHYGKRKDACGGDSGGPFAVRYGSRWYLLGIVSWGIGCAKKGEYGFYTHASRYLPWIHSKNVTLAYSRKVARKFNVSNNCTAFVFIVRSANQVYALAGSQVILKCVPDVNDVSVRWYIGDEQEERTGGNLLENCNLDSMVERGEAGSVKWYRDERRLSSGALQGIFVDQNNRLVIPNFGSRYEGYYKCIVRNGDSESFRSETNITEFLSPCMPKTNPLGRYSLSAGNGNIFSESIPSWSLVQVSAECDEGAIAQPSVTSKCLLGTWMPSWPRCEKPCSVPRNRGEVRQFVNGFETRPVTQYRNTTLLPDGTELVARCRDPGRHRLVGDLRRTCHGGQWIVEEPQCQPVDTKVLFYGAQREVASNGTVVIHVYRTQPRGNPKHLYVVCKITRSGLRPPRLTTPLVNDRELKHWYYWLSHWKVLDPVRTEYSGVYTCSGSSASHSVHVVFKAAECEAPGEPEHGRYIEQPPNIIQHGANVSFVCDEDYRLVGSRSITCHKGEWSQGPPVCKGVPEEEQRPTSQATTEEVPLDLSSSSSFEEYEGIPGI